MPAGIHDTHTQLKTSFWAVQLVSIVLCTYSSSSTFLPYTWYAAVLGTCIFCVSQSPWQPVAFATWSTASTSSDRYSPRNTAVYLSSHPMPSSFPRNRIPGTFLYSTAREYLDPNLPFGWDAVRDLYSTDRSNAGNACQIMQIVRLRTNIFIWYIISCARYRQ